MNKSNGSEDYRAIRRELDRSVDRFAWKMFRAKFQELNQETRQKVIEYRSNSYKKGAVSLLHKLVDRVKVKGRPPVPMDLVEDVIKACPHLLTASPTPLSTGIARGVSAAVIECLLMNDPARKTLEMTNSKGDTPLLQAIKCNASQKAIRVLIDYDTTGITLLTASEKRHKVPLFYVVNNAFLMRSLDRYEDFPQKLEYFLLQTHEALLKQQALIHEENDTNNGKHQPSRNDQDDCNEYASDGGCEQDPDESEGGSLLKASLACAHLVGGQHAVILVTCLSKCKHTWKVDSRGNTILHHFCQAQHNFVSRKLLKAIIKRDGEAVATINAHNELPLHLALKALKPWKVLETLVESAPEIIAIPDGYGCLPLHLAISLYPSHSCEVLSLWKCLPEVASVRALSSGFYPFQLCAIVRKDHDLRRGDAVMSVVEADLNQLSDIFFFLRAAPEIL